MREPLAAPPKGDPFDRPELDGLRFFAFLAVFLHHALPREVAAWTSAGVARPLGELLVAIANAGGFGVDLFFALSAFLITELLLRERERFGSLSVRKFLVRRALRIWPLYFGFILLACLLPELPKPTDAELMAFGVFLGNWHTAFFGFPKSVISPLWSVSIEEQFYVLWPWLVRKASAVALARVGLGMLLVGALSRAVIVVLESRYPMMWCATLSRIDPIACGLLLCLLHRKHRALTRGERMAGVAFGAIVVLCVGYLVPPTLRVPQWSQVWALSLVAAACASVLYGVLSPTGSGGGLLGTPILRFLGKISYGLYVFHVLALQLMSMAHLGSLMLRTVSALCLALAMATGSYYFLERPFLRFKERYSVIPSRRP
jgi:peptidoglycan/LPS O-acetylase OafA/YrhL